MDRFFYGIQMSLLNSVLSAAASVALGKDQKEQASLLPVLIQTLNQYPGGLNGLLEAFNKGGLGAIVSSWLSQGPKLPIAADQLQQVLGSTLVTDLAEKSGLSQSSVLGNLTTMLPALVEKVVGTTGVAPTQLDAGSIMTSILGMLTKK